MFFFQIYFSFVTRFVGFSFFFQIYFSFEWFICSQISFSMYIVRWIFFFSDLPFFWLMFCSESLEQLDEYKKGNKNFIFIFSFFYHLLRSTLFSIIFVFRGYFSVRSTYFCSVNFFRFSFLCWQNVLGRGFFLISTVWWIFSSQIFFVDVFLWDFWGPSLY